MARILAVDAQHNIATLSGPHQQDHGSSYMTPPATRQSQPQQQQQPSSRFAAQAAWEDDVAYLAPALAFNLRLQHELWPLMPQIPTPSGTDRQSLTGGVQSTSGQRHEGQSQLPPRSTSIQLLIKPLRELAIRRAVEVPQSGTLMWCSTNPTCISCSTGCIAGCCLATPASYMDHHRK